MEESHLHNRFKGALIMGACLLFAIYLGYMIGNEDYGYLLLGTALVGVIAFWFLSGPFFWVFTIAASFLAGTFPILRGQFTPFQVLMAMGLAKFLIEDVILRRVRLKLPSRFDLLMIAGFMSIIFAHGVSDRFGMRFLGSTIWGGRQYVNIFVGLIAFFVIQSIPMPKGVWAKFPYVVLAIAGFDLLVAVVTTIFPSSIYVIYPFYSAVSNSSLQEAIGVSSSDVTGRIGAIGNFGVILIFIVFATISLRSLFHPGNFFRLVILGIGSLFTLLSGYRSSVVNAIIAVAVVGVRDLRMASLAVLPILAVFLFSLSAINSEVVALPKQVQRGLAFLPGEWDTEMAQDAAASNDFRFSVWNLWYRQYFPAHPLIGRGFGFNAEWTKQSIRYGNAVDYQQMVETGNIHNGLLAAVDTFGIIGTIFFVAWNIVILVRALRISFEPRFDDHFALRFLALFLAVTILFYWGGATSIGSFVPGEFALVGLFLRLSKDLTTEKIIDPRRVAPATPRQFRRQLARA